MKRILYILLSVLLFVACNDEVGVPVVPEVNEGEPVKLTVSINTPEELVLQTRALGEMTDAIQASLNLWLLVFDENGVFLQAAQAEVGENTNHDGHTDTKFTVELNKTSAKRIIHFIAYDGAASEGVGAIINTIKNQFGTESSMIAQQLFTQNGQAAYWQRQEKNGINEETTFNCVPLVRNFSKITVGVKDGVDFHVVGYTVVKAPSRGTVAPYFNSSFIDYVDGRTNKTYEDLSYYPGTSPGATEYSTSSTLTTPPQAVYLYETPNASEENMGRTALVIQGYSGTNASLATFYKVDLIYNDPAHEEAGNMFYNILRNFAYNVTIKEVKGSGYANLADAINGVPSNNLSASTTTASLSRISDGLQMIEVSNIYYCYNSGGTYAELKYRYRYYDGTNWVTNNNLVNVTTNNNDIFTTNTTGNPNWSITSGSDWNTITMTLKDLTATSQPMTSIFHIYASANKINEATLIANNATANAQLKNDLTSGELLYRNVRVDLRNPYPLIVDCQSYVRGASGESVRVDLLIPQTLNEALFPMDFLIEAEDKYIYPDASSEHRMPVHVGQSIAGLNESSFQYTRTVSKLEYASLGTKTYNGVTYKVVPCEFKTNTGNNATTVHAYNQYFVETPDSYSNTPVAFTDDTEVTVTCEKSNYFGKAYPIEIKFNVTPEAVSANTVFHITVREGDSTNTYNYTPTSSGENTFTGYSTQTINGSSVEVTITAQYNTSAPQESKSATLALNRRYFVIKAESFTTNITDFLDEQQTGDGSEIYVAGTYVGWFGRGLANSEDGYLTNNGPKQDYLIDRAYQNYATLNANDPVMFKVYNPNHTITATGFTIEDLDNARIAKETGGSSGLVVTFSQQD